MRRKPSRSRAAAWCGVAATAAALAGSIGAQARPAARAAQAPACTLTSGRAVRGCLKARVHPTPLFPRYSPPRSWRGVRPDLHIYARGRTFTFELDHCRRDPGQPEPGMPPQYTCYDSFTVERLPYRLLRTVVIPGAGLVRVRIRGRPVYEQLTYGGRFSAYWHEQRFTYVVSLPGLYPWSRSRRTLERLVASMAPA